MPWESAELAKKTRTSQWESHYEHFDEVTVSTQVGSRVTTVRAERRYRVVEQYELCPAPPDFDPLERC